MVKDAVDEWPNTIKNIAVWTYVQVAQPVLDTTEGRRICWAIGAFNGLIWLAWQFPRLKPVMMRSFTHSPLSGISYTLLTSTFRYALCCLLEKIVLTSSLATNPSYIWSSIQWLWLALVRTPVHFWQSKAESVYRLGGVTVLGKRAESKSHWFA